MANVSIYTIQYDTIQYSTMQYNTIQYHTMQYNTTSFISNIEHNYIITTIFTQHWDGWQGGGQKNNLTVVHHQYENRMATRDMRMVRLAMDVSQLERRRNEDISEEARVESVAIVM